MRSVIHSRSRRQRGFALLIMLVLVTMGVLYLIVNGASVVGLKTERQHITGDALVQAKQALLGYAATYRDKHTHQMFGYLPCPDMDGDGSADDCGSADGISVVGLLPYKQLGLPNNLDSEGNCLWYAVSGSFKAPLSSVLPIMNWDTQGQLEVRDASGNVITQPNDASGGAAAVLFSVGTPLSAQVRSGATAAAACGISASAHADAVYSNYIDVDPAGTDLTKSQPFSGVAYATIRAVQGSPRSSGDNDQILAITPREIFAVITKRNDLAIIINAGIADIHTQLESSSPLTSPAPGNNLPTTNPFSSPSDDYSFYRNWSNNFRYLACSPSATYCFDIDGIACDGALLFAGQSITGSPRASTAATSAYFEDVSSAQAYSLVTGATYTYSGGSVAYAANNRSADIVECLVRQPLSMQTVSFTSNLSQFDITQSTTGMVGRNTVSNSVRLGNSGGSAPPGWGCFWYPQVFPMRDGLRAYFAFTVPALASGTNTGSFTFALIDANPALNPTPTSMCGGTGEYIGFAGINGVTVPLNAPKIAIEFDKTRDVGRNDPPSDHAAFVYWGDVADSLTTRDDDNIHGAGGTSSPRNPVTSPGLIQNPIVIGTTYFVRLDVIRTHDDGTHRSSLTLKVYVSSTSPRHCDFLHWSDLSSDLNALCPALDTTEMSYGYLTDNVTIDDVSGSAAMRQIYLGFTTGQDGPSQRVSVSNFAAAAR